MKKEAGIPGLFFIFSCREFRELGYFSAHETAENH
jgi:hypothetical protein